SAFEVTCADWQRVMPQAPKGCNGERGDYPATGVSWNDSWLFVNALRQRDSSGHYRLPSEAEFEIAARAGSQYAYPFGDDPPELPKYANCHIKGAARAPAPVGRYRPNRWGFFDLLGNAWEWANDDYALYPGATPTASESNSS